jgi:hypothetical protein
MAAYVELYLDQGTTFNSNVTLTDDTTNAPLNITGYTFRSQMRRSYYSANATATITCSIVNAGAGEISMNLSANTTSNIKAGRYLFDLEAVDTIGSVTRVLEGIITVTPEITRL